MNYSQVLTEALDSRLSNRIKTDLSLYTNDPKYEAMHTLRAPVVVGLYSIYEMPTRTKYVDAQHWSHTPGEMNREYLRFMMREWVPKKKMIGYDNRSKEWLKQGPPYYFGGYRKGEMVHIDISSCYYNIYRRVTLDMKFHNDQLKPVLGKIPFDHQDWLALQSKSFKRGISGTISRKNSRKWFGGNEIVIKPEYNKFLAPELWGYIMCTLHCIAHEVIRRFGAGYFAVDGVIADARHGDAIQEYIWDAWRLPTHVKHGPGRGEIRGVGSYDVGTHKGGHRHVTGPYLKGLMPYDPELSRSLQDFLVWLEARGM
jgi:hypothetical protein